ncbi:hypothetical protein YTPLAS72_18880 [Nitrospira sp.]|nr:hypothetical protein YTPLAS72_18880 [Nitrospira sp.]
MQLSRIKGTAMERSAKLLNAVASPPDIQLVSEQSCVHGRMIDEVRTRGGKRTGKVRCLECQAIIADPYQGMK